MSATELTGVEVRILKTLNKHGVLDRKQLSIKTSIVKGWSRLLGAASKDDLGSAGKDSLIGRGLVRSRKGERLYLIA